MNISSEKRNTLFQLQSHVVIEKRFDKFIETLRGEMSIRRLKRFFQPNKLLDVKTFSQDPICWGFAVMVTIFHLFPLSIRFQRNPLRGFLLQDRGGSLLSCVLHLINALHLCNHIVL